MVQRLHCANPESVQSAQKALINAIGRQLITDFHPAVKNVASASQNLLRSFQSLSHHFYEYTAALYALGFSGTNSDEFEVREQSKTLQKVTEVLKKVHSEQIDWMDYFTAMALTINQNSKTEKERLKALISGFSERERQLSKAIHRGKQMPDTQSNFYETELEAMRDQQSQRYRFFADKHLELLRRYHEWMKDSLLLLEKELNLGGGVGDELDNRRRNGQTERQISKFGQKDGGESENSQRDKRQQKETQREQNGEETDKRGRKGGGEGVRADVTRRERGKSAAAEDAQREAEARQTVVAELAAKFATQGAWPAGRKREFPAKIFRPTPIVPTSKYRHSVADGMLTRNLRDSQVWKTVVTVDGMSGGQAERRGQRSTAKDEKRHGDTEAAALRRHFYAEKPTEQRQQNGRVALDEDGHNANQQKLDRAPNGGQIRQLVFSMGRPQFSMGGEQSAGPLEQCHARGESQDSLGSNSTANMHRCISPMFAPTDYGRLIECTTPFSAQGDNQLSLAIGERVLLVKSGTRGWVLGRSTDGVRSGWFPAKFVKLV
ncbi:hypothetical protein niasHS_002355 [Heterodera schachtii]|uniref:SH3 domain-containing protein n=1 Tax=Heterodera schachtii TaxID=97005 RepID=A0ABD2KJR1_HETSC